MNKQHPEHTTSSGGVNSHASQTEFVFKGPKLEECDLPRLGTDARNIWDIMVGKTYPVEHQRCYGWYDLNKLAAILKKPHSSLSAAVRAFRYPENGGHKVDTRRATEGSGTWLYRLTPATPEQAKLARESAAARKVKSTDELLELQEWIHRQVSAHGGWPVSPFVQKILGKIEEMVKERK